MPVAEAAAALAALARPVAPVVVGPAEAVGAVAAGDVVVEGGRPEARIALRDGWAVSAAESVGASPYGPVRLSRPPAWVEAGAPLPPGTDALLPPEALGAGPREIAALGADQREIEAEIVVGEGTRAPGAELPPGARLLAAGERVSALHGLALAAAGPAGWRSAARTCGSSPPSPTPCRRSSVPGSRSRAAASKRPAGRPTAMPSPHPSGRRGPTR
ncbi:hypothetical protein [Methylobacterium aquaticum]|uniref:hypothetical protein n=1 Tax=Methylobacterium aquaticum TaxID=270351 RepID=UPI0032B1BB62